ncbi:MAG: hydrogenase formation protein HypD [Vulcanibacillus sp.]
MLEKMKVTSNPEIGKKLIKKVISISSEYKEKYGREPAIMEVCGSHTMALARTGLKRILKGHVNLISGPGCPVCVTDQISIDAMIELADDNSRIVCTFGDMMRVPGTKRSLMEAKTEGKDIRVVYSPTDAVEIAEKNPNKEVVFLGIGFETTIPVLAVALKLADEKGIKNFSMWLNTKLVEPVLRVLLDTKMVKIDGFLLPGHVSIVLGKDSYDFLVNEYNVPGIISGFESVEMLSGIYKLIEMLLNENITIINDHKKIVTNEGNIYAQALMAKYLEPCDEAWRGIGIIEKSGLDLREEYGFLNAKNRFDIKVSEPKKTKCRCGEIISGLIAPDECSLFGNACNPVNPIGPCMVSTEGSCAAFYQYMRED